ncbi:MAG: hypothetical protein WC725_03655 [Patescibacteria group bacterium]|jgi:hypothetical protein
MEISGKRLFLLYSFPCAEGRHMRGHIDREHLDRLCMLVKNGGEPTTQLLRYCFPHAVRRLREYADKIGADRWSLATVADFWRHHHGHKGDCRVILGKTLKVISPIIVIMTDDKGDAFKVINIYGHAVAPGDRFYLHFRVLIEKEEN